MLQQIIADPAGTNTLTPLGSSASRGACGGAPGPLYGLPVLIKDTQSLVGVRFTKGEPRHAHRIGADTDPCIAAVEAAGGIVMGKVRRCSRARRL